ncbi:MAG: hypothetical protein B6U97_02800 [Candidatus Altiarchaeales archaeon ex4484_96]|nr:MAG: hypothetical protein B6U97_02800 [Candidatus Altiarchaeales archaeon ex4484_96]
MLDKINKGFHLIDFKKAASLIHEEGALLRSYLLVNLPYVIDLEKNLSDSIDYALRYSDSIVLINLLPHGHTPLFRMWLSGEWSFLSKKEFHNITDKYASHPKIELDEQTFRFTPLFPDELKTNLKGVGENYLTHPHFEVWQDYLLRWYTPPINKKILLFLPCSYKKPYSISATHKGIIGLTKKYPWIHEVMLSNAGVVPREYENHYPFNSYDWDERGETPEIKNRYIEVTSERIRNYLQAHINHYRRILCFLRDDSESLKALDKACGDTGYDYHNLLTPGLSPQSQEALNELKRGLSDETSQI